MARLHKTLVDYLVIAISPALIMIMVASLVFFLFSLSYTGPHQMRIWVIYGLFIFAAVLIARISIEEGKERSLLFALPLGALMVIAGSRFLDVYWFLNLAMIGLIWWSAHQLTWDCTVIDEEADASGEGLLQGLGVEESGPTELPAGAPVNTDESTPRRQSHAGTWWQRWAENRRQPHAPGRWVIYFALAALPLFGFGPWFVSPVFASDRRLTFRLLFTYLASAFALLVTTSFLGLRRYLRQRRLEMPQEMAAVWLGAGGVSIVVLLVACALLPRPGSEPFSSGASALQFGSPDDLNPSRFAFGSDGPKDERQGTVTRVDQQTGQGAPHKAGKGASGDSKNGEPAGQSRSGSDSSSGQPQRGANQGSKSSGEKKSQSGGESKSQSSGESKSQSDSKDRSRQSPEKSSPDSSQATPPSANAKQQNSQSQPGAPTDRSQKSSGPNLDQRAGRPPASGNERPPASTPKRASSPTTSRASNPTRVVSQVLAGFGFLFKIVFYLALVVVTGWLVWRYRDGLLASLRKLLDELCDFWNRLFGKGQKQSPLEPDAQPAGPHWRRFSDFANPFRSGLATRVSVPDLIRYSFEALEAWGRDNGLPRRLEQTPGEYAQQLARHHPPLAGSGGKLAELFNLVTYSRASAPEKSKDHLEQLWANLEAAV